MRATEIIRGVLDLIDQVESNHTTQDAEVIITPIEEPIQTGVDTNRFKHIFAMLDAAKNNDIMYANAPNTVVATINSVTDDAGGGWNGPKNPADLRGNSLSLFPGYQAESKGQE